MSEDSGKPGAGDEGQDPLAAGFRSKYSRWFFAVFSIIVVVAFVAIVKPFLTEVFLAFVLFILGKPLYDLARKLFKGNRVLASITACLAIIFMVFVPFVVFTGLLATSAYDFYQSLSDVFASGQIEKWLDLKSTPAFAWAAGHVPALNQMDLDLPALMGKYLGTVSKFVYTNATSLVKGLSSVLVGFVLVIFVSFYMFLDGDALLQEIITLSPLDDRYDREIIDELVKSIKMTFKGSLVIAFVQGVLGALGFLMSGIHSWALWGVMMSIASFIPVVGTALIWVPAAIYLALTRHFVAAGFLAVWGVVVIGLSDNVLRTWVHKGESQVHPLLIFFSVMGGVATFGFLGIILGPLVLSLLVYVIRIYKKYFNPQKTGNA